MAKTDKGRSLAGYYTPGGYRMAPKMIPHYLASSPVVMWVACASRHAAMCTAHPPCPALIRPA